MDLLPKYFGLTLKLNRNIIKNTVKLQILCLTNNKKLPFRNGTVNL